jgi:hypothetical protein
MSLIQVVNIVLCLISIIRPGMLILEDLGQNTLMRIVLGSTINVHASAMHRIELILDIS